MFTIRCVFPQIFVGTSTQVLQMKLQIEQDVCPANRLLMLLLRNIFFWSSFSITFGRRKSLSTTKQIAQWTLSSAAANSSTHALSVLLKTTQKPDIEASGEKKSESRSKLKDHK